MSVHGITSTAITQDFCFKSDGLKRCKVNLRNDLRSFELGPKDTTSVDVISYAFLGVTTCISSRLDMQ